MPEISVLMPVFNASLYLREAIESILGQSFSNFEFIIINDGSTDDSESIILSYSDKRIKYIKNIKNIGVIETLNKGVALASGKYLARMDADDISERNRFKVQYNFLEKHRQIGLCGSWAVTIDENGQKTGTIIHQTDSEMIKINLLFSVPLIHPSVMGKTEIFQQNKYPNTDVAEDYALWLALSEKTLLANIPQYLLQYRWHNTNVSKEKQSVQIRSKQNVISKALEQLNLYPTSDELITHTLSFNLYDFENGKKQSSQTIDTKQTSEWFCKLITANNELRKYNKGALRAFLWGRWIVLCLATKERSKILFPQFKTSNPKVIIHLLKQIVLLSKK